MVSAPAGQAVQQDPVSKAMKKKGIFLNLKCGSNADGEKMASVEAL